MTNLERLRKRARTAWLAEYVAMNRRMLAEYALAREEARNGGPEDPAYEGQLLGHAFYFGEIVHDEDLP